MFQKFELEVIVESLKIYKDNNYRYYPSDIVEVFRKVNLMIKYYDICAVLANEKDLEYINEEDYEINK